MRIAARVFRLFCLLASSTNQDAKTTHPVHVAGSRVRLFVVLLLILGAARSGSAQSANSPGIEPFSTQTGSAYDSINLSTSNIMITLPIRSKNGPIGFSFALRENPSLMIVNGGTSFVWSPTLGPGLLGPLTLITGASVQDVGITSVPVSETCQVNFSTNDNFNQYNDISILDATGAAHLIGGGLSFNPCTQTSSSPIGSVFSTSDGSGYTAVLTGIGALTPPVFTVYDKSGNNVTNVFSTSTTGTVTTPNGLSISATVSDGTVQTTQYSDPLGPLALTSAVGKTTMTTPTGGTDINPNAVFTYQDSSGNTQSATLTFTPFTFRTDFGCPTVPDAAPAVVSFPTNPFINLPTSLTLPDGRSYGLTYEPIPGFPGSTTGRIASITLPTGGSISYTYTGGTNNAGIYCNQSGVILDDGLTPTVPILTRTVNDANGNQSVWVYNFSEASTPFQATTTTVTDPLQNATVYQFFGGYQTEQQTYQGAVSSGSLLKTVTTCYNGNFTNCTALTALPVQVNGQITQTDVYTSYNNGPSSLVETRYNPAGMPSEVKQYDYGAAMPPSGAPLVDTTTSYGSWNGNSCSAIPNFIQDRPCEVTVKSPTGTASDVRNSYDNAGNLLSIAQLVSGTTYITKSFTYASNGAMQTATDGRGNVTTYTNTACNNLLPTQISSGGLSTSEAWDCNGAVRTSITGPNVGQTTTWAYADPLYRSTSTTYPDGGQTTQCYSDVGGSSCSMSATTNSVTTTTLGAPDPNLVSVETSDGLGRPISDTLPNGATTNTVYNLSGYVASVSAPHLSTSNPTDGTTQFAYDALGRKKLQTQPDQSTQSWSYSTNVVLFTDEAGHTWSRNYDALGRPGNVTEPDGASTGYVFDALGNLTIATQIGVAGETRRNHSFQYDSLSRLLSATNPETGTISYVYDGNGNVTSKTDARRITTTNTYDALNRITLKVYSDGVTPEVFYGYDNPRSTFGPNPSDPSRNFATVQTNPAGHLTNICVAGNNDCSSEYAFSYDANGRMVNQWVSTPSYNGGTSTVAQLSFGYDLADNLTSLTYPDGRVVTQTWKSGELQSVTYASWNGQTIGFPYISSTAFWPTGTLRALFYGNNVASGYHVNNRLQTDETSHLLLTNNARYSEKLYCFGVATSPIDSISPPCDQLSNGNNGTVWEMKDVVNSANNQTFSYDSLKRITSASGGGVSQQYGLDSFGNMSMMAGGSAISTFDPSTNRINNLPCASSLTAYDAAGNQLCDSDQNGAFRQYGFDAEGRVSQITMLGSSTPFESYIYDGNGIRISKTGANGSSTEYINVNGQALAERNVDGSWSDYIFANGKRIARSDTATDPLNGAASTTFYHFGRLGSTEVLTDGNGNLLQANQYLPFGQEINADTSTNHYKFTGKERDTESGLDYFGARYYGSSMGRFMSPDDGSDQDITNPQSLNLYSYVQNNPLTNTDPDGHTCQTNSSDGNTYDDGDGKGCDIVDQQDADRLKNGQYSATVNGGGSSSLDTIASNVGGYISNAASNSMNFVSQVGSQLSNIAQTPGGIGCMAGLAATGGGLGVASGVEVGAVGLVGGPAVGAVTITGGAVINGVGGAASGLALGMTVCPGGALAMSNGGKGLGGNQRENKQANDAKQEAERETGKKFDRALDRKFHDEITGQGYGYHDLVEIAKQVLQGHI